MPTTLGNEEKAWDVELERCFGDWNDMMWHNAGWDKNYSVEVSMVRNSEW